MLFEINFALVYLKERMIFHYLAIESNTNLYRSFLKYFQKLNDFIHRK